MKSIRFLALAVTTAALLAVFAGGAASSRTKPQLLYATGGVTGLSGGASSMDELIQRFVTALEHRDRDALDALRVTESEYRNWIVPGSVEPGEKPQILKEDASAYFWGTLNGKTIYTREALLSSYGGRHLEVMSHTFRKGTKTYANFVSHGRLELVVRDEQGEEAQLRTGSIAEVDGRFKFISFICD